MRDEPAEEEEEEEEELSENYPKELEVLVVYYRYQKAILTNGVNVPVTHWFDRRGGKCKPQEAVTCVCGNDEVGWFAVDLEHFGPATVH